MKGKKYKYLLFQFKVNSILMTGSADPYFLELCRNKLGLTCLTFIPLGILKILALEMGSYVLESMADCWSEVAWKYLTLKHFYSIWLMFI